MPFLARLSPILFAALLGLPMIAQTAAPAPPKPAAGPRKTPKFKPVNLNTATRDELLKVPGMNPGAVDKIIKGRPFLTKSKLVTQAGFTMMFYQSIKDRVYVTSRAPARN